MKRLTWIADSRSRVKSFPASVREAIGFALYAAQLGETSVTAKALRGLGAHVMEISAHDASGTYRAVYTVSEVQGRDRYTEDRNRTGPAATEATTQ